MKLIYGYELNAAPGEIGHVVCPPQLNTRITVSVSGNTSRWIFYGTRKQILDWMKEHSEITLVNSVFVGGESSNNNIRAELVIDVQYVYDKQQTYGNYFKSFFTDIYDVERVKVEIRPRVDSKDKSIQSLCRVVVACGTKLGDLVGDLEAEWYKPGDSYVQQTLHLFNDTPTPNNILGANPPTSVQVCTNPTPTTSKAVTADSDITEKSATTTTTPTPTTTTESAPPAAQPSEQDLNATIRSE